MRPLSATPSPAPPKYTVSADRSASRAASTVPATNTSAPARPAVALSNNWSSCDDVAAVAARATVLTTIPT